MGIRFKSIEIRKVEIPFRLKYTHALASRKEGSSIIVKVVTECGKVGYGETIPRSYLTGEDIDSVWHDILKRWWPRVKDIELNNYKEILPAFFDIYSDADRSRHTASYAGIELACIDAMGKAFNQPARNVIENYSQVAQDTIFKSTGPIGTKSIFKTKVIARIFKYLNFPDIKVKTGLDCDQERLQAIRKIFGKNTDIRADANAAWDTNTALKNCDYLKKYNISSIEQPVKADNIKGMARIKKESGIEVMADESLCTRNDAKILIAEHACDIFNIRLAKCGGFNGCLELHKIMKEANLSCQIGVLVGETSIITGAEQEFMTAIGPQRHHEFPFSKILLKKDPASGASAPLKNGCITPPSARKGFGVTVNEKTLDKITIDKKTIGI